MRIAIIVRRLNIRGGTQRMVAAVASEFKKMGHEVTIYTFSYEHEKCYHEFLRDIPVISLDFKAPKGNYFSSYIAENRAAKKLACLIDSEIDILNPHDQVSYRVAYYYKKHVKNAPSVWMMNDMPTKMLGFLRDQVMDPNLRIHPVKKIVAWLFDQYEICKFIKPQDRIMVLDFRDRDWAGEYFGKEAIVIRNGMDIDKFTYLERRPPPPRSKKIRVLMNGIFFAHRRFEDMILAAADLIRDGYDITMSMVGDTNSDKKYFAKIKNLVSDLGLESRVKFCGQTKSDAELLEGFHAHDIFVFPNHLQSWGIAPFEAMATGLPVIVSTGAGASEVLTHGENAMLTPPLNPQKIAEAIKILASNPSLYSKLSKNGRRFVEENISWERYARDMFKIFEDALGRKRTILVSLLSQVVIGNFRNKGGVLDNFIMRRPAGVRIVFLTAPIFAKKLAHYAKDNDVVFASGDFAQRHNFFQKLFQFFYSYLIFTGTTRILATFGARADIPPAGGNRHLAFLKSAIANTFGRFEFIKKHAVPFLFFKIFSRRPYKDIFDRYSPDLVFATSIAVLHDIEILAEAKRRGIKTVGMACNWDHLNKYFMPLQADALLVQNEPMKDEAIAWQAYDHGDVFTVGFPQFDAHVNFLQAPVGREIFFRKFGIPSDSKLILFVSGSAYSLDEPDIIMAMRDWIREGKLGKNTKLMIRPYVILRDRMEEAEKFKDFMQDPHIVFNWTPRSKGEEAREDYFGMLYHADVVIPIFSTMAIEAALFNKPTITIGFDGHKKRPFHQSVVRLERLSHFKHVLDTGSVKIARSFPELFQYIDEYIKNPTLDEEKRKKLVEKMCYKVDGLASKRLVDFVYNTI